jgi:hypothetical protein
MRLFVLSLFRSPQSGEGKLVRYSRMANASVLIVKFLPAPTAFLAVAHLLAHRIAPDVVGRHA